MARRKDPAAEEPVTEDPPETPVADPVPEPTQAPPQEAVPEELTETQPASTPAPQRSLGLLGPLLGGALATVLGFGLSHFNILGLAPPDPSEALAALDTRLTQGLAEAADPVALAALKAEVAAQADRLAALEQAPPPDLSALQDRLAALEAAPPGDNAALAARLAQLEQRLAAQPQGAEQAEIDAALARLAAAEAEALARAEAATAAATAAERSVRIETLKTAILNGAAFEAELQAVGDPALTAALAPYVAGIAPLGRLQADFPDAARAVLALARDSDDSAGWGGRLLDFLADQTEARPVTPQEGDTTEAILSRAEAALGVGRLPEALFELEALDPGLRPPLEDWIARAEARVAALAAVEEP